jgi:hypothetical protein
MIYKDQGHYERALSYFEEFFALSCSSGNQTLIDSARLNLGCVKGFTKQASLKLAASLEAATDMPSTDDAEL